jgi:hypothetical protein
MVLYVLYGKFPTNIQVSAAAYRTVGIPDGIQLRRLTRKERSVSPFTDGDFAKTAGHDNPAAFARIQKSPECMVLQGEVKDPENLNYLRDSIGLVTWFLDYGGIAVMDPQQLKLYDGELWRKEIFEPSPPKLLNHVVILVSGQRDGTKWFHTRGLRKFGRPDLSMHNVPTTQEHGVIDLFNRFIILQAQGDRIPEGKEIQMASLPANLTCHHAGSLDNLDFNNTHVEIRLATSETDLLR